MKIVFLAHTIKYLTTHRRPVYTGYYIIIIHLCVFSSSSSDEKGRWQEGARPTSLVRRREQ